MKCQNCGGQVKYIEEVEGSFVCNLSENGEQSCSEFYGDALSFLECNDCGYRPKYTITEDGRYQLEERKPIKKIFFKQRELLMV